MASQKKLTELEDILLSARITYREPRKPLPTQSDLAKRIGISGTYWQMLMCGMRKPSESVLIEMAELLDLSPERLSKLLRAQRAKYARAKLTR